MTTQTHSSNGAELNNPDSEKPAKGPSRRAFLSRVGSAAAATIAGSAVASGPLAASASAQQHGEDESGNDARARAVKCFNIRVAAAQADLNLPTPNEVTNGVH
jgi:hypothetical protein